MTRHTPIDLSQLHASYQGSDQTNQSPTSPANPPQTAKATTSPETEPRPEPVSEPPEQHLDPPDSEPTHQTEAEPPVRTVEENFETEGSFENGESPEAATTSVQSVDDIVQHTDDQLQPDVPDDLKAHGVRVSTDPRVTMVHLPISDEAVFAHKNDPPTSANRWLSELAQYLLHKAHIKLKRVGQKVVRVLEK